MPATSALVQLPIQDLGALALCWLERTAMVDASTTGGSTWVALARTQDPDGLELVVLPIGPERADQHRAVVHQAAERAEREHERKIVRRRVIDLRGARTQPDNLFPKALRATPLVVWRAAELAQALHASVLQPRLVAWDLDRGALAAQVTDADLLLAWMAEELKADQYTQLNAAGGDTQRRTRLARVFLDLAVGQPSDGKDAPRFVRSSVAWMATPRVEDPRFGVLLGARGPQGARRRAVLVGGPGQGKTTLGLFLCQVHRAALLATYGTPRGDVKEILAEIAARPDALTVIGRRLPLRVVLHAFAAALARGDVSDLWGYLAWTAQKRMGDTRVTAEHLRRWLQRWPSLLVLDGLDEVPATANRGEVLSAVQRFLHELEEADLIAIATTRPQGYRGELSVQGWEHQTLQDLSPEDAKAYAGRLVAEWSRADRLRRDELVERAQRAIIDPGTAHLARSPLQVMILTLLVEQTGRPPRDRWRLFREYFRIIFDRERERGIEAFEILREQQDLIERLHAEVGYRLQLRAERAQGTDAGLPTDVFDAVIRAMLIEDGHTGAALDALVQQIHCAALDRLVFLVGHTEDRVGFEIRSLQEFHASERLFWGEESLLPRRLEAIAAGTHWRNVLLFAAGRIAAERPHLLDRIPALCDVVDRMEGGAGARVHMGVRLALELLGEGALAAKPKLRDALVRRVMGALPALPSSLAGEVLEGLAPVARGELMAWLEANLRPGAELAWGVVLRWGAQGDAEARALVAARTEGCEETVGEGLISVAIGHAMSKEQPVAWARELLGGLFWKVSPGRALAIMDAESPMQINAPITWRLFAWRVFGLSIFDWSGLYSNSNSMVVGGLPKGSHILAHIWSVKEASDAHPLPTECANWEPVRKVRLLCKHLDETVLAESLEILAETDTDVVTLLQDMVPWPLAACLQAPRDTWSSLARSARTGSLGGRDDWIAAERRWAENGFTWDDLSAICEEDQPLAPTLRTVGIPARLPIATLVGIGLDSLLEEGWIDDLASLCRLITHPPESTSDISDVRVWDMVARSGAMWGPHALLLQVLRQKDAEPWTRRLARAVEETLLREPDVAAWRFPNYPNNAANRLLHHFSQHPTLLPLVVWLCEQGHVSAGFDPPDPQTFSDPQHRSLATLLQATVVTTAQAPALAERLRHLDPPVPNLWPRVARICATGLPEGGIELLNTLLHQLDRDPEHALHDALHTLLSARSTPLHYPSQAADLKLPADPGAPGTDPHPSLPAEPPIHLRALHIEQLRGWEILDLSFTPDPTCGQWLFFVGENGTGKTTLLRALALALVGPGTAGALLAQTPGQMVRTGHDEGGARVTLSDGRSGSAKLRGGEIVPNGPPPDLLLVGYGPRRGTLLGVTRQELNFNPTEAVETLFIEGGNLIHAESWLMSLDHRALKNPGGVDAAILNAVLRLLCELLPGVEEIEIGTDAVRVRGPGVGDVPLQAVSDGYLTTAGWVIDLVARWMERERHRGRAPGEDFAAQMTGLVLIDEVDLHLHPRWQWSLVEVVRRLFPKLSFVVTTHNPVTLLGAKPGEVWGLERDDHGHLLAIPHEIPLGTGVDALLTGAVFRLPSTLDRDTVALLDHHRELLRTQPDGDERRAVETELRRRLGRSQDNPLEDIAQRAVADVLRERAEALTPEDRARARDRAREALRRMARGEE